MAAKLVYQIPVENHGIYHLALGDLNNDGAVEFVTVQAYPMNREICCLRALDQQGNLLWQHGTPLDDCNWAYSDIPVEVVDWDGDGFNEVVYVKQAYYKGAHMWCYSKGDYVDKESPTPEELRLSPDLATERAFEYEGDAHFMVLDGRTGAVKEDIPIPAPADDCICFGFFDGTGKLNLLAKDRYWNLWAISHEGKVLWHISDEELKLHGLGHFPAIGDIDGDGLDEVFITSILVDHDGTIKWRVPGVRCHNDGAVILSDLPEPRLVTVSDKLRMLRADGSVVWERDGGHLQFVYAGRFAPGQEYGPYQIMIQDIAFRASNYEEGVKLYGEGAKGQRVTLYDWNGNVIWAKEMDDQPPYSSINWLGDNDSIVCVGAKEATILDVHGETIESIQLHRKEDFFDGGYYIANVFGDARDELVIFTAENIWVYTNAQAWNQRRFYNHSEYQTATIR